MKSALVLTVCVLWIMHRTFDADWTSTLFCLYLSGFLVSLVSCAKTCVAFVLAMNEEQRSFAYAHPIFAGITLAVLWAMSVLFFGTLWFVLPNLHFNTARFPMKKVVEMAQGSITRNGGKK